MVFHEMIDARGLKSWCVRQTDSSVKLGMVKWCGEMYIFEPAKGTLFAPAWLIEIGKHCQRQTTRRMKAKQKSGLT